MKENNVTLTKQDMHSLFLFHERADDLERIVSKCDSAANILSEALKRINAAKDL